MFLDLFAHIAPQPSFAGRLAKQLAAGATTLLLTACGGATGPAESGDLSIRLSGSAAAYGNGRIAAKATSDNLLDLNRNWGTWSGDASGVSYNADTGTLSIPASSDSVAMVTAVERFELPLVAGTEYTLAVQASHPEMAAVLFLFDTDGAVVPVPGVTDSLASVRSSAPLTFVAPENIAGLYLQVQNRWQAAEDGALSAELTFQEGDEEEPDTGETTELLDPTGPWTAWDGTANGVAYDAAGETVVIDTPNADAGNRHGIRRHFVALNTGDTYTLSTQNSSDTGASTLLFLFDGGGALVPFTNPDTGAEQSWIAAPAGESVSFVAPEGITSVVVQVQSGWMAGEPTRLLPSLTVQADVGSCTPVLSGAGDEQPVAGYQAEVLSNRTRTVSTSSDGRWTVFISSATNFLTGETNSWGRNRVYLYDAQTQILERILPTDPESRGDYRSAKISGDGSTIYVVTDDGFAIDGQASADRRYDLFRYNRLQRRTYRAVTAPQSRILGLVNVSPDGQRALVSGWAELMISANELDPSLATSRLLEYNTATNSIVARSFPEELNSNFLVVSGDLIHAVYWTNTRPVFVNGVFTGTVPAEYVYRNIMTGTTAAIAGSSESFGTASSVTHNITSDGRYVIFQGNGQSITSLGQQFNGLGLYRWERSSGRIIEVGGSVSPSEFLREPSISDDGNMIAYRYNRIQPGFSGFSEVRITDITANRTVPLSRPGSPRISGDGTTLFMSDSFDGVNTPVFVPLAFDCEQR
ncbi:MAG: hypothetical protein WBD34_22825 [Burkholderiaceae bacterium]